MTNYLPETYDMPAGVTGDTYPGIPNLVVEINAAPPTVALASVRIQFRSPAAGTVVAKELTSEAGDITINNAATWDITVEPFTNDLDPATYDYDIEFTDVNSTIRTYVAGTFPVARDVTR